MFANKILAAAILLSLSLVSVGCQKAPDKVKNGFMDDEKSLTYGQAFSTVFDEGVWTETKDESGEKVIQFTGKISSGLHEFAIGKLGKSSENSIFYSSCNYLASLVKKGIITDDSTLTINLRDYPVTSTGHLLSDIMGDYASSPDNRPKMQALNMFYMKRYWEEGSDVLFQFKLYVRGRVIKVVGMSNKHWDNDFIFSNKPENVLRIVLEYAKIRNTP